jgi:cytoskeleton-associated protein 5
VRLAELNRVNQAVPVKAAPPAKSAGPPSSPPIKASGNYDMDLLDEFAPPAKAPPARFQRPGVSPVSILRSARADSPQAPKPLVAATPSSAPSSPPKPAPPKKTAPPPSAAAGPSKPPSMKPSGSAKTLASSPSEPIKYKFTPEDAAAQASSVIPAEYHTRLADAAWKTRLEAAEEMVKWVEEGGGADAIDSEVMMRFLGKTPGWGEKNFQVSLPCPSLYSFVDGIVRYPASCIR